MARELAAVVIERDTLLARNVQLHNELSDAIGDIDLLLYDYNRTVQQLAQLHSDYAALTTKIDSLNAVETAYWRRMAKGVRMDLWVNTTAGAWDQLIAQPRLSLPVGGKWHAGVSALVSVNEPVRYLLGVGYRVF